MCLKDNENVINFGLQEPKVIYCFKTFTEKSVPHFSYSWKETVCEKQNQGMKEKIG